MSYATKKMMAVVPLNSSKSRITADKIAEDPISNDAPYPRYTPGIYEARCISVKTYLDPRFKRHVCNLTFQLMDGEQKDKVCLFLNLGNKPQPEVTRGSEFRRAWIIANGSAPIKRQRMSPRVFEDKIFSIEIRDVKKRADQREHLECEVYSTVKQILKRVWP